MLSEKVIFALNNVSDAFLEETKELLDRPAATRHAINKRTIHVLLIAAVLAALLTACAIGYSIHQRRQQELRTMYEVEEKHVDAWVDYELSPTENTVPKEPTLTLLSTYNDGVFCTAYVNASPVEEDEAVTNVDMEPLEDGWFHWLEYRFTVDGYDGRLYARPVWNGEGEYGPEDLINNELVNVDGKLIQNVTKEAKHREIKKQCYDPSSKTMSFLCPILLKLIDTKKPITMELGLWDHWQRSEKHSDNDYDIEARDEMRRSFGTVTFDLTLPQFCTVCFDNPPIFTNDERGKAGRFLGVDISATQIIWHLTYEEQEDDSFEVSHSWGTCIDHLLQSATLNFADGTSISCGGIVEMSIVNCEIQAVSYHTTEKDGKSVIDVHELVSVTIADKTFSLPPITDSQY